MIDKKRLKKIFICLAIPISIICKEQEWFEAVSLSLRETITRIAVASKWEVSPHVEERHMFSIACFPIARYNRQVYVRIKTKNLLSRGAHTISSLTF